MPGVMRQSREQQLDQANGVGDFPMPFSFVSCIAVLKRFLEALLNNAASQPSLHIFREQGSCATG